MNSASHLWLLGVPKFESMTESMSSLSPASAKATPRFTVQSEIMLRSRFNFGAGGGLSASWMAAWAGVASGAPKLHQAHGLTTFMRSYPVAPHPSHFCSSLLPAGPSVVSEPDWLLDSTSS